MDINEIWDKALVYIRQDINSVVGYKTYIKDSKPVSMQNGIFTLAVSMSISKNMIKMRYKTEIEKAISQVLNDNISIEIILENEIEKVTEQKAIEKPIKHQSDTVNPKYTFENFVVGASNQYANAVAMNTAELPGQNYNPLFLYGNSGLGKTHLMHAIGNEILKNNPDTKVLYVSSERFTNDLINSVRDKNTEAFRRRYREIDVLLVDDVQFIEGKEGTQEEFFHTFNDLYNKNKQIVLTSDRKPKDLITLEERLRTRFEWGLITDIMMPDYETRVAILKKKAESQRVDIDGEVLEYIAQRISSSIRELEGALIKIISYAGISQKKIDIELAEFALKSILPEDGIIKITDKKIIDKVCTYYNVTKADIIGQSRMKNVTLPRQVAMYLCKILTEMNFVMISRSFGNKDRTTVMHNVDKIMDQIKNDDKLKSDIDYITKDLHTF